jgi:hypothetical protein
MLKRCLIYFLIALGLVGGACGTIYSGLLERVCGFFLIDGFKKAYGAQINFKRLEGGIYKGFHFEKVHVTMPKNSFLDTLEAEEVNTAIKVEDVIRKKDNSDQSVFLQSTLIRLKRSIGIDLSEPLLLLSKTLFVDNKILNIFRFDQGQLVFSRLRNIFLFIHQISFEKAEDENGNSILKILARSPDKGHRNQILVYHKKEDTHISISDYSLSGFSRLIPGTIVGGALSGELFWGPHGMDRMYLSVQDLRIKSTSGSEIIIRLNLSYQKNKNGKWSCDIKKLKLNLGSIKTESTLELKGNFKISKERFLMNGALKFKDVKVNDRPFLDVVGNLQYDSKSGILQIEDLNIGKEYRLKGEYNLLKQKLDFTLDFLNADLSRLKIFFPQDEIIIEGRLGGFIRMTGDPSYPRWDGLLNLGVGRLGKIAFEEAYFGLSGFGSVIDLKHSKIITSFGRWVVLGAVDLKETRPLRNVKLAMDPQHMGLHGFKLKKDDELKELTLQKQINKRLAFSVKARSIFEDPVMAERDADTEIQLEYEYHPNQNVVFRMDENEQILGLRRKLEF